MEKLLQEIQDQCSYFANELITLSAKRVARTINTWPVSVIPGADDYPNSFTTFDILCCEYQSKSLDEISPWLENALDEAISKAYNSLSAKDKFFIEYSECCYGICSLDCMEIDNLIRNRFVKLINEHWAESRKIRIFQERRTW